MYIPAPSHGFIELNYSQLYVMHCLMLRISSWHLVDRYGRSMVIDVVHDSLVGMNQDHRSKCVSNSEHKMYDQIDLSFRQKLCCLRMLFLATFCVWFRIKLPIKDKSVHISWRNQHSRKARLFVKQTILPTSTYRARPVLSKVETLVMVSFFRYICIHGSPRSCA